MSATKEFLETWLQENVGNLPAESGVSIAVLAQQFEQDAEPRAMVTRYEKTKSATLRTP
ncbi:hypothetical protein [Allomesorhizobium alhagi]|nr:hypothetical protein [Mesorhizobium alhagi]